MSGKYSAAWWERVSQNAGMPRSKLPDLEAPVINAGGGKAPTQLVHPQDPMSERNVGGSPGPPTLFACPAAADPRLCIMLSNISLSPGEKHIVGKERR